MTALAPPRSHLAAVAAVSASMLAFEILLVRLFEFSHWHHFAGLAVSLALLGLGAAGTGLAIFGGRPWARGDGLLFWGMAVQAAGTLGVLFLHSQIALRPLFAAWDVRELARLLLVDFAAFIPFLGAGMVIGQVFTRWPAASRSIYAVNLLGSGAGSVAASVLLAVANVETALALAALLPATALPLVAGARARRAGTVFGVLLCLGALVTAVSPPAPRVSDFKPLSNVLDLPDARLLSARAGLPGTLSVIRSDSLRIAPGLSLQWPRPVPPVDAAVVGSNRLVPMPRDFPAEAEHTRASLAGLAFQLRSSGRTLVLGASEWQSVVAAGQRAVVWVEPDHRLLELARQRGLAGPDITLVADGLYRYLVATDQRFDVVAVDAAFAGGDAATEDYLMTVEGLTAALRHLAPRGLLALPLELSVPPRRTPRALATIRGALDRLGVEQPGRHVAALRGLQETLLLASPQPLSGRDIRAIERFAEHRRFDLVWLPGLRESRTNRFHRLDSPVFYRTARAVFGGHKLPAAVRWFETAPADTARPYFWRTLNWDRVPDFLRSMGRQRALSYLDWTLILTAVSAVVAAVLAFVLIVAPLGRIAPARGVFRRASVAGYFGALGLGYMLLELACFQRAIVFLGEPVLTAALVFSVFLIASGIGSLGAPRSAESRAVLGIFAAIAGGVALSVLILWRLADAVLVMGNAARLAAVAAALAPLGWALGRAFPWALRQLAGRGAMVPWAWAVNGFASVVAASLASLVSVQWGQPATLGIAAACYATAGMIAWRWVTTGARARPAAGTDREAG